MSRNQGKGRQTLSGEIEALVELSMITNYAISLAAIILALTWTSPLGASQRMVRGVAVQRGSKLSQERAAALLAVVRACLACRS